MKKIFKENRFIFGQGFTLVEALIYVGILSIVSIAVVGFAFWSLRFNAKSKAQTEVLGSARRAVETMTYELRHASSIYTPTSVLGGSSGQLSIETMLDAPAGETATYKDFFLDDGVLYLKQEGAPAHAITSEKVRVSNLNFSLVQVSGSTQSIRIDLGAEYNNPSSRPELQIKENLTSTVALRSY